MFTIKSKKTGYVSLILGITGILATTNGATAATATSTSSAMTHYKLANALVEAGKPEQAIDEYKTAFQLAPNSQVGAFSLQALNAFGQLSTVASKPQGNNEIARQTQELKAQAKRQADDNIKATNHGALNQIANIEADKAAAVNNVLANPSIQSTVVPVGYGYGFGRRNHIGFGVINTVDPIATQARINQVNNIAELQKERVKAQAAEKAERLKEAQEERANLIDESAENLQSQMVGRGVKLNPKGSNLFVRSYQ